MPDVDLFVLGGGSGGVACARRAAAHGARVALAEESRVGGTCVVRGCVPKKLMNVAAHLGDLLAIAPAYGWRLDPPRHDFAALVANREREIARLEAVYRERLVAAGVHLLDRRARVVGREGGGFVVDAGGERWSATRVVVAVGAAPQLPDVPGAELAVTSDRLLEGALPWPARLAVIGAGYIGLEQSSIFLGLGCDTHLALRRDLPLHGFDDELRVALRDGLAARGMRLHPGVELVRIERAAGGLAVVLSSGALEVDAVLLATGRRPRPRTTGLGLEALGVELDEAGAIVVDRAHESRAPGLHAIGDCSDHGFAAAPGSPADRLGVDAGQFDLTPVAIAEGRALADRLHGGRPDARVRYDATPTAVFSIPEAASVGLSEGRARELGLDVAIFRTSFRPLRYALAQLDPPGRPERTTMKLVVDRASDRVIGAHMVGDDAAEIIQALAVALTAGVTKRQLDDTMALHPTTAEELVTMYAPG